MASGMTTREESEEEDPSSADITVRFPLTKGDGDMPERSAFSPAEVRDLRLCVSLSIAYEPDDFALEAKVLSVEVIYDGITPFAGSRFGYRWGSEGDGLEGYPAPILRFSLDRPVEVETFLRSVSGSYVVVATASAPDAPFYAEDHNGYCEVLPSEKRDRWVADLEAHGVRSGEVFTFPDGMPTYGHLIPAMEFARPPQRRKEGDAHER